jgi:uncharacterized sporulation protein YeaH/YhbH (DUF444 family)
MELALGVASLVVSALTIGGALMALGAERQKREDLDRRHAELASEARARIAAIEARVAALEVGAARTTALVEGLREAIDRIEETVTRIAATLQRGRS